MNLIEEAKKWTITNLFIVPLLNIDRKTLSNNQLINAYISDEIKESYYDRGIYLLFKPLDQYKFEQFIEKERERKAKIIDEYDYEGGYIMLVYQYDKEWEDDVKNILSGNFSKLSKKYQDFVPKEHKIQRMGVTRTIPSLQHSIIKRLPECCEYWKETYGLDINYKEHECWHFYKERESYTGEDSYLYVK